jgi:SAM-dependent methyltransferase
MKQADIFLNNLEEYEDPDLYDVENDQLQEIGLLLEYFPENRGTIIDLACGTGRLAIPLASRGFSVVGVDISEDMLSRAKSKAAGLDIKWILQDISDLNLTEKSGLIIMAGNAFQHFLTNESQNRLLRTVHRHLTDSGVFIFGTRFPAGEELLQPHGEEYWRSYTYEGKTIDLYTISEYDALSQIQHYTTIRKFSSESGIPYEIRSNISLRYVYPKEMERLLNNNGLNINAVYGDWKKNHLKNDSKEMIYVVQKK